jgi:hypothetical protein
LPKRPPRTARQSQQALDPGRAGNPDPHRRVDPRARKAVSQSRTERASKPNWVTISGAMPRA